jgi:LacI family transcriptional regulator
LGDVVLATLREVAKRAGVSIKTVSRIVNNDAGVTAKTRAAVTPHLAALNYVPNHAARQMRMGTSSIFGLMTDAIATTPYSVDIVRGAQAALEDQHQTLLIASSDGDAEREQDLWRMFRAHRVAGVVYASMFHRPHDVGHPAFDQSIILANCFAAHGDRPSIIPDDEAGGYEQAKYLLSRGHRRIGIITLISEIEATHLRAKGMRRAFMEAGVAFDEVLEVSGYTGSVGKEVSKVVPEATRMLEGKNRPTAIICGNDTVALQVYAAAAALGLNVPRDLSVIGFDDLRLISETLYPQLTTVALPYFDIGRKAIELSYSAREHDEDWAPRLLVPCPLVERHSCRPLS